MDLIAWRRAALAVPTSHPENSMARTAASTARHRGRVRARHWTRLSDEELLGVRFSDLELSLARRPLKQCIARLNDELERAGIAFRPHCWLADEWFSPDGVPGIAIPFYLAHPRLRALELRMMREVEGGNANWFMRILRHEAGHALDSAFRLRRRRRWREIFGPASLPYPESYRPRPGSRRFVQHLEAWYAQSHPTEDFAETFAVWLRGGPWRTAYREWPAALAKLEYVDELMRELRGQKPPVRSRRRVEPIAEDRRTLGEHYRARLVRDARGRARALDHALRRTFTTAENVRRPVRAVSFLRRVKASVRRTVALRLDVSEYLVHQVVRVVIKRAAELGLYLRTSRRHARRDVERLIVRIARLHLNGSVGRHLL
jgi:hypothetical protein